MRYWLTHPCTTTLTVTQCSSLISFEGLKVAIGLEDKLILPQPPYRNQRDGFMALVYLVNVYLNSLFGKLRMCYIYKFFFAMS